MLKLLSQLLKNTTKPRIFTIFEVTKTLVFAHFGHYFVHSHGDTVSVIQFTTLRSIRKRKICVPVSEKHLITALYYYRYLY